MKNKGIVAVGSLILMAGIMWVYFGIFRIIDHNRPKPVEQELKIAPEDRLTKLAMYER